MILTWDFTPECHPGVFFFTPLENYCPVQWKKGWFDRSQFMLFLRCWGDILSHPADNQRFFFYCMLQWYLVSIYSSIFARPYSLPGKLHQCSECVIWQIPAQRTKLRLENPLIQPKPYILKFWNLKTLASSRVKTRKQCCVRILSIYRQRLWNSLQSSCHNRASTLSLGTRAQLHLFKCLQLHPEFPIRSTISPWGFFSCDPRPNAFLPSFGPALHLGRA